MTTHPMAQRYEHCQTCRAYRRTGHTCHPAFDCRLSDKDGGDDRHWREINAYDAEAAASEFCDQYDGEGDYTIIQSGEATVLVRRDGEVRTIHIEAESRPHYSARDVTDED